MGWREGGRGRGGGEKVGLIGGEVFDKKGKEG